MNGVSHAEAQSSWRGTSPQPKELNHGFHGCARIETNKDTNSIGIGRVDGAGGFAAESQRNNGVLLKDDRDFAMNSIDSPFCLSVPIREIRGSSFWKRSRRKDANQTFAVRSLELSEFRGFLFCLLFLCVSAALREPLFFQFTRDVPNSKSCSSCLSL